MHTEIGGDLLERHTVRTVASDPDNVLTELLGIRLRHDDILSAQLVEQGRSGDLTHRLGSSPGR
jgi:hypothetical protein